MVEKSEEHYHDALELFYSGFDSINHYAGHNGYAISVWESDGEV
jgi:hypothetical protein